MCAHPADESLALHSILNFPHLIKNVCNAFFKTGFNMPSSRRHAGYIKEAWEMDDENITLKAIPHINRIHLFLNGSEKMRADPAIRLFSVKVLKGFFLYQREVKRRTD